jgi:hypothetical protein
VKPSPLVGQKKIDQRDNGKKKKEVNGIKEHTLQAGKCDARAIFKFLPKITIHDRKQEFAPFI